MSDWTRIDKGYFGVDWTAPLAFDRCDPYLVWTDITTLGTVTDWATQPGNESLSPTDPCVLIEGPPDRQWAARNGIFFNHPHQEPLTTFVTASFKLRPGSPAVHALVDAVQAREIKAFTWQAPRRGPKPDGSSTVLFGLLQPPGKSHHPRPAGVLIGVIDDGCPYGNDAFWDGPKCRLKAVWQQDRVLPPASEQGRGAPIPGRDLPRDDFHHPPVFSGPTRGAPSRPGAPPPFFMRGAELTGERLNELGRHRGERWLHRRLDDDPNEAGGLPALNRSSHGSHVISMAAGEPDPLHMRHRAERQQSVPDLAFVQLPRASVDDTSGSSLAANALDGIHYLIDRAEGRQLVINLSYGTYAGPHDGTSMFERALVELLDAKGNENVNVVLPAGNSHLQRSHVRGHLTGQRGDTVASKTLYWRVLPDDPTDGYLEVWFPPSAHASIRVKPPGGAQSPPLGAGKAWKLVDAPTIQCAVIFPDRVAQGTKGTMALIAVAPTRRIVTADALSERVGKLWREKERAGYSDLFFRLGGSRSLVRESVLAPHGVWEIEISNVGDSDFDFHAWIERDDMAPDLPAKRHRAAGRQSYFVDEPRGSVTPESTLNGIATLEHDRVHVIGAMQRGAAMRRDPDRQRGGDISDYSSAGPNRGSGDRCWGPDAVTFADESRALPGLLGGGMLSGSRVRMNGTSVAAAVYTRMLAKHLATGASGATPFKFGEAGSEMREPPVFPTAPSRASKWLRGVFNRLRA